MEAGSSAGLGSAEALAYSIEQLRDQFPGLDRRVAALDGAAGTLVPRAVIEAVAEAMRSSMANSHGHFDASRRSEQTVREAREALADLVGGAPEGVVLGPNMTTLTFHLADALSRRWRPGDEVVVTSLDHDANIRPWVLAAQRAGARVHWAHFDPRTGELPVAAFEALLSERTRLVALTAASNAIGTCPDVGAISALAHAAGALTYIDGVHATPHCPIDVGELGADLYALSTYKLYGPHAGAVIADPQLLAELRPAKLAPAPEEVPERFERGTPAFELLAGVRAAIDWLAGLSPVQGERRTRLLAAMGAVARRLHELEAIAREGLAAIPGVRVLGCAPRRTSTLSFVLEGRHPRELARELAARGVAVWDGDNYARELMRRFGLDQAGGAVRASIVLYNDERDVARLLDGVNALA